MAATTSFKPGGYPGRPYGSFAGKEQTAPPHNPGRITTLWGYGGPGHLYGSFAGKSPSVEPPPVIVVSTTERTPSGVKKRIRVRRADFSSQENYEFALRAALSDAQFAVREEKAVQKEVLSPPKRIAKPKEKPATDTAIKISAVDFAALQQASEMDEVKLIKLFIDIIESEW